MALIIRGHSRCSICGSVIEKDDSVVAWPAFLMPGDELGADSDSAMHESCFEQWEHAELMTHKYRVFRGEIREPRQTSKSNIAMFGDRDACRDLLNQLK